MIAETLKWVGDEDGYLELIDQRKLPAELVKLKCSDITLLYNAIKTLAVRGAPAIGVAAAYGLVLGLQKLSNNDTLQQGLSCLDESCRYLTDCRPTGINLFRATERIKTDAERFISDNPAADLIAFRQFVLDQANAICAEDVDMCRRIGQNGQKFINDGDGVLTHCNAGALATAGQGTALSVIFEAQKQGKKFKVFADETRPLLQGSRLTAWELSQAGIDVTVICDNMAGMLMKKGKINLVITGADRIAANGDTANKIGTYSLSILAGEHKIPFYIAAPSSTFDLNIQTGLEIPIERRGADELRFFGDMQITPKDIDIYNPAFDVTPAENIAAIITEKGVIEKPDASNIAEHFSPQR